MNEVTNNPAARLGIMVEISSLSASEQFLDRVSDGTIRYDDYRNTLANLAQHGTRLHALGAFKGGRLDHTMLNEMGFEVTFEAFEQQVNFIGTSLFFGDELRSAGSGGVTPGLTKALGTDDLAKLRNRVQEMRSKLKEIRK